ncbi:Tryprostatin B 6-hydroxylase [Beauveria bassiana]|uniref:Tryprostatin B 6-hydroxylase n=1 Tax=Beauveria bassiana TaxID=176275 RepID=A0A2N6NF63_BEABA|nr:Tryprostatin B 6-hydroxylase [Beauveria bassiana]
MNYLLAFLAGQALHALIFCRGEWDAYASDIVVGAILLNLGSTVVLHTTSAVDSWWVSFRNSATLELAMVAGLLTSMLVYRALFHALCRYPGPFMARLSNFYLLFLSKRLQLYRELQQLHERYGDIVRLGPSTLSVTKLEAVQAIYGPKSKCRKGPWDFIAQTTQSLVKRIEASQGQVFDAAQWFKFFSFEVMGWMAFGQAFDLLATGKSTYFMNLLDESANILGTVAHLPWLFLLMKMTPVLNAPLLTFRKWLHDQLEAQMEKPADSSVCSLFSSILEHFPCSAELTVKQRRLLEGDMFLIIVAGSETVAVTLQNLLYELSINPDAQRKLQQEIDANVAGVDECDPARLARLGYLQACIDETLRLWPPVASGMQRITPPEGLQVGDVLLPGNMIVQVPAIYVYIAQLGAATLLCMRRANADFGLDKEAFPRPNEFIPERWTTKPELVVDRSVFFPFSVGESSFPLLWRHETGDALVDLLSTLGLLELRHAIVEILKRYTVQLAPGFTSRDFEDGIVDRFSTEVSRLDLTFTKR